jgi:hypothetical protein
VGAPKSFLTNLYTALFFLLVTGVSTQGLVLARQAL